MVWWNNDLSTLESDCDSLEATMTVERGGEMNSYYKQYLKYIKNTDGHATLENFIEDWEPIGQTVWNDLIRFKSVEIIGNKIYLTKKGEEQLKEQP